ncbi:FAS-associated factor 2 [Bacillus rossius redtenbacheri]|uniref:FAS-associated factor 2 n=1 Tax=Bacillus rossius redtenbacheri TaxID=93214 RepID=UPI002FDEB9FC
MAEDLSPEQTEKIVQFQDLTGIEDMTVCRDVLQRHAWDLEVAVQEQLNLREGRPSVYRPDSAPLALVDDRAAQHTYFAPPPSGYSYPRDGLLGFVKYVLGLVVRVAYNAVSGVLSSVCRLFLPDPRTYVSDPLGDVMGFIAMYEERYGARHPVFYQGTYSQALSDAKQELRFLLVYLHCDDHQDTDKFCRVTLTSTDVIEYINTNMLFWACSVTTPEGYRVSQALRENAYPFLAVIVLRDNRMTVVGRLEGSLEPRGLLDHLQRIVADNEASLVAARADRVERSFNQTLRQQQDEAYLESLQADQEKERRRTEERERREGEERLRQEEERAEQDRKEEIHKQKVEYLTRIPEEPSPNDANAVHIVIKLPNGLRLERRFLQTDSLEALYYYVFCHPESPDVFEIVTSFPKKVLPCLPSNDDDHVQTLSEAGLKRREVLFVYDLEA